MAAEMQREMGITKGTKDKEKRAWNHWIEYTKCIGFQDDIWLKLLTPDHQTTIIGAFAAALRRRHFSKPDTSDLAAGTVQETIAKLDEIFRTNLGYNPTHIPGTEELHPALSRQFKEMKNMDPGEKQQRALLVYVYRKFHRMAAVSPDTSRDLDKALAELLTLAFFFCMRSCEYFDVQGEQRTKLLCVKNLRFYTSDNRYISGNIEYLHLAAMVSITFEFQKRDIRNDIISHQRLNDKQGMGEMCPVRTTVLLVQRLYSYTNSPYKKFQDTPINLVLVQREYYTIPSSLLLQRIRLVVDCLGFEKLGFTSADVGTHSNRSGGAIGMFLAGTPVYTIMLMG
jgi:hypothetical protein